ncbi:unnamed protein product [Ostreobium quekettii]|uniref:protein-serine/threonine phosphatase n=1 Tax=Ostreobium quekettii TaxID=121088 RepID=A0A8S1JBT3_9CHLO|nr:unnamed protein product [Ostreobium quekettii]
MLGGQPKMVAPLVALNALTQGTGPTVHVAPDTSDNKLGVLHEDCMRDGHCLVVGLGDDSEVVLAPVQTHKGDGAHALFWGYCILRGVVSCGSLLFENGGQLPAVFDLDETLVLANSGHNLGQRLEAASRQMQDLHDQLECCTVKEEREKLQAQIAAVEHEQVLLREDHQMVQSYAESNKVEVNGQVYHAREETVESGNGVTSRPIIRIPEAGLVLTRIDSSKPETSMVIRIRPGWENLRAYLSGQMENKRQKWKVFVCTAAEREYAHEAWRLLDTAGDLIPAAERPSRIFSGARKKSLMHTLKLGPFSPEPLPAHCVSGMNIAPLVEGVSEMPLALIIDDRLDVWDRRNRSQIVQVTPYLHYKSHKSSEKIPKYDANELLRVKYIFQSLRADLYFSLCEVRKL